MNMALAMISPLAKPLNGIPFTVSNRVLCGKCVQHPCELLSLGFVKYMQFNQQAKPAL